MKYAKVTLGYNAQYLVPVKDLSKFLDLLSNCRRVDYGYLDDRTVNYFDEGYEPQITLVDDTTYVSQAEYDKLYRAEQERRDAQRRAEKEAGQQTEES